MELLPDQSLGLALVGRDEPRLRLDAQPQRLSFGVEDGANAAARQLTNCLRVEAGVDASRERARKHDDVRAAGEVRQLLEQHLQFVGADVRSPLVDLSRRAARRIHDDSRRARLVGDPDEVVEDRLGGELLDDARSRATAREPRRDDRYIEPLERPRDVDPLPARERQAGARAVPVARLEVRDGERPVEGSVERDGDDHEKKPQRWCSVRRE